MHRFIDILIPVLGALTLVFIVIALLHLEGIIHLSDPMRRALSNYGWASAALAVVGGIILTIQHLIYLRRRKQEREKLSRPLDSPDETPAHQ